MNRSALEMYNEWAARKNTIVSAVLQEATSAVETAIKMRECFEQEEINQLEAAYDDLTGLLEKYAPTGGSLAALQSFTTATPATEKTKRKLRPEYLDDPTKQQCEAINKSGDTKGMRCSRTAEAGKRFCGRHKEEVSPGVLPMEEQVPE